jgi:hypothetical protein
MSPSAQVVYGAGTAATALTQQPAWSVQEPVRALLLARDARDLQQKSDVTRWKTQFHVLSFHVDRYPVKLFINALTGLPMMVEATISIRDASSSNIAWNALGDVVERSEFTNWDRKGDVRYPVQINVYRNGAPVKILLRAAVDVDLPADMSAVSSLPTAPSPAFKDLDELKLGEAIPQAPDPARPIEEIAAGVVQIPGGWYSTIIRQDDGIVIVDAPISAGYSRRVLAEANRRFPGLRIKALITSTAFRWHVAGIREYVARGIPIYAREQNVEAIEEIARSPHTLDPDSLARAPRAAMIRVVTMPMAIGTGQNAVQVLPIKYGEQPMLMTWLPNANLLHTAEMVQPLGPEGSLILPEALSEIQRTVAEAKVPTKGLRVIGMHMSPTPWTAIGEAISKLS